MQKGTGAEFKSLLSEEEYNHLIEKFKGNKTDFQTNHYFDTSRFSLKALDTSLRVRERESLVATLKRKKGYMTNINSAAITAEQFKELKETGVMPIEEIKSLISPMIGSQKLVNFLSLSTLCMFLPYKSGVLFIDKSSYLGVTDFEIEYSASSYHEGKKEFIELIKDLEIQYKKADKKIKRAYNAYKRLH